MKTENASTVQGPGTVSSANGKNGASTGKNGTAGNGVPSSTPAPTMPVNGNPSGINRSAPGDVGKLAVALKKEAKKLGFTSFEAYIAWKAVGAGDRNLLRAVIDKLWSNATTNVNADITERPSSDELDRIRAERERLYAIFLAGEGRRN